MPPPFDPRPLVLEGRHVRLEPLAARHAAAIHAAARDPGIWEWMLIPPFGSEADAAAWIEAALAEQAAGREVAWATVRRSDGRLVGSTRYLDIRRGSRGLEIGHTWLAPEAQRTAVNTEAKYLQLRHAFEALGAERVQLKTDERNARSRAAIARLGATFEGILRKYQTRFDGFVRNTAMYSITAAEWPGVRVRLEGMLAAG
ncbi:MAG: GNAT family N-acetyltransferase [Opitutaceae bacterium]|nr:GNAT family N-acetyltransferase [Opitutaceae bacterium]